MDNSIYATVTGTTKASRGALYTFAISHSDQELNYQLFEEGGTTGLVLDVKDAVKKLVANFGFKLRNGGIDALNGGLSSG